ncbi:hypothetical protein Nepgr_025453 [Nepenthes gracilis]|uniref:Uncharacterized protein n=1 Tax=Nepenthes gracilis TaxID=150966 RepID=A0AAD3Y127_NEPGR|nr:hypothetical protein Nepgr_025453 [Nepenthes gracilis]
MNEAEHVDISPAKLAGVNENVDSTFAGAEQLYNCCYESVYRNPLGDKHHFDPENELGITVVDGTAISNTEPSGESLGLLKSAGERLHMHNNNSETHESSQLKDLVRSGSGKGELADAITALSKCTTAEQLYGSWSPSQIVGEQEDELGLHNKSDENSGRSLSPNKTTSETPHCMDCHSMHNETLEGKILSGYRDVQCEPAESGVMASDYIGAQQWKELTSHKKATVEHPCEFGRQSLHSMLNERIEGSNVDSDFVAAKQFGNISSFKQNASEQLGNLVYGSLHGEQSEQKQITGTEGAQRNPVEGCILVHNCVKIEQPGPSLEDAAKKSIVELLEPTHEEVSKDCFSSKQLEPAPGSVAKDCLSEQLRPTSKDVQTSTQVVSGSLSKDGKKSSRWHRKTSATLVNKKYMLRSSAGSRSVSQSKPEEKSAISVLSSNMKNVSDNGERRGRKGRTSKQMKEKPDDGFSSMRKHLRYILHRMQYEQNLIDAYSSEGWRGQSLDKLRPEKELERAKADIRRSKLKIRAFFQRLDEICAEGRFPDSLFDSEGLIDTDDIFCAKCGSKDVSANNDIILCDGACDRGFHQLCLYPPLRTEEIPPGEEGWLCPACDCKVDCIDLLNDSEGTKLSISDSWEKVFPEEAAAGNGQDNSFGLPSDDSEDNDYDPDGAKDDADVDDDDDDRGESASTSDESDFSSASEDLGDFCSDGQYLGLPSDDSEDDYDPEAPDADELVNQPSSSSDFTSASEDLDVYFNDNGKSRKDGEPPSFPEPDEESNESLPRSSRRHVERLDYKKLYDETYGNDSSDSSADEEWMTVVTPRNRKNPNREAASVSSNGYAPLSVDGTNNTVKQTGHTPRGKTSRSHKEGSKDSYDHLTRGPPERTSRGKNVKRLPYRKLGEAVTQRLHASFKEDQYPDHLTKEKLAEELELTLRQVSKWFDNARWSFNHPSHSKAVPARGASKGPKGRHRKDSGSLNYETTVKSVRVGSEKSKSDTDGRNGQKSVSPQSRMAEKDPDHRTIVQALITPAKQTDFNYSSKTSEAQNSRTLRKRKRSAA